MNQTIDLLAKIFNGFRDDTWINFLHGSFFCIAEFKDKIYEFQLFYKSIN